MKTSKHVDHETKKIYDKLHEFFPHYSEHWSIIGTLLGMTSIMGAYIIKKYMNSQDLDLPVPVKYSVFQGISFIKAFREILTDKAKKGDLNFSHLPCDDESWHSIEDFEKRFIFIVSKFYEELKKDGKIK